MNLQARGDNQAASEIRGSARCRIWPYNAAMPTTDLQRDVSLQPFTTLHVPVLARWFLPITDRAQLSAAVTDSPGSRPPLVLGEGSNCLFTDDYDGLVLQMALKGIEVAGNDECRVRVAAGENWHAFVRWSLRQGYSGIENLALIPGTVGAAPIQNIGAYGMEVESTIESVEAWDCRVKHSVTLDRRECDFAYRDSIFKRQPGRYIVLAVNFRLNRQFTPVLEYAGLRERLAERGIDDPSPTAIADAVESLRREKLPDPALLGNAGSFFKNPVVHPSRAAEIRSEFPELPVFPAGDNVKLSAGWLIEKAGMKGYREGDAGISDRHALVLVNHGAATGEQLWAVAARVREKVRTLFGIELEPEPRIY